MKTDLHTILRGLETVDAKLAIVESEVESMTPEAVHYDVSHVRSILLGVMSRLDTVIHDTPAPKRSHRPPGRAGHHA